MKNRRRLTVYCGVFAALTAVLSQLSLPMPSGVPITLQTFAVALYGFLFSPSQALKTTLVYLACGAVGLPVFGMMRGGISVLTGPTGGFLWGFLFYALFCSLPFRHTAARLLSGMGGLLICHFLGVSQYCFLGNLPLGAGLISLSLPLLPKDLVLLVAALLLAKPCKKALERADGQTPF